MTVTLTPLRRRALAGLAGLATAATALLVPTAATAAPAPAAEQAADLASRFTLAVMPDTQFYSRYSADQFLPRYGTDPFRTQTAWLAENHDALNIPFVTHLGDVVDQVTVPRQWEAADTAMKNLEEARVPYSILPGNHDVLDSNDDLYDDQYDLAAEPYLTTFGPQRTASQASLENGSDPTGLNQFHVFEAEGQQFLVLALAWRASDATLAWADQVMADHPTLPTILTTHQVIDIDNDGVSPRPTDYGDRLWDKLIKGNDQIFLTLNGHFHGAARQTLVNDFGHEVTEVVIDYQMAYEGGNGYLGLYEFDLTNNEIDVQTASPWVTSKPADMLTSYDQPFLEGPQQQFTLPIDFAARFAGFNPSFSAGEPTRSSLSQAARDILLDGFEGTPVGTTEAPGSTEDYPHVDGTLAHWRPSADQGVIDEGEAVVDVAGGNDLHRASLSASGSATAEVGDVTVTADADPLSSAGAAMCFANSDKTQGRFSYLVTDADASVNDAKLDDGYTIETFLKVDPSWSEDTNAWAKAVVRSGNRSKIGVPETRWDWTASPAALGLSNLKELQWTEVPSDASKGDRTAWSGEIVLDRWMHVALVNDPATAATTMYVDGAPVLRNTTDSAGQAFQQGMPWLFGSDWVDDKATNGWAGCIGETRVIDHPTNASQWLTARADLTGLAVTAPAAGVALDGASTVSVSGTGLAGATVTLGGALGGSAVVGADGVWRVDAVAAGGSGAARASLAAAAAAALPAGEHVATATQSLGTRSAAAVEFRFSTAAVVDPGAPGAPGAGAGAGSGAGQPGAGAPGAGTSGGAATVARDGSLAYTGASLVAPVSVAVLLMLLGGVLLVVRRRRAAAAAVAPRGLGDGAGRTS
ncbi:metallophosphoesterase [Frigoribacterium sp. 2-23]|uniref:metallophosphoesterase n=1 Tax=Frigoribacterium sp. 2-23 TaxID=3415006 RepID=UPI003C6EC084